MPDWKIFPSPAIPFEGTSVDLATFLAMFLLLSFSAIAFLYLKNHKKVRPLIQFVSFFIFVFGIYLCLGTFLVRNIIWGVLKINIDNLYAFSQMIAPLLIVSFTFVFGRIFCGYVCPTGFLVEIPGKINLFKIKKNPFLIYLSLILVFIFFTINLYLFGFTKDFQTFDFGIFWALGLLIIIFILTLKSEYDKKLKIVKYISLVIIIFVTFLRMCFFPPCHFLFHNVLDYSSIFSTIFVTLASLFVTRAWCRYVCPLGALLSLISPHSFWKIKNLKNCLSCKKCEKICPVDAIKKGKIDYYNCINCGECQDLCEGENLKIK